MPRAAMARANLSCGSGCNATTPACTGVLVRPCGVCEATLTPVGWAGTDNTIGAVDRSPPLQPSPRQGGPVELWEPQPLTARVPKAQVVHVRL